MSSCPTRYLRNSRPEGRAVDIRAKLLQGEYTAKARKADHTYGNAQKRTNWKNGAETLELWKSSWTSGRLVGEISEDFKSLMEVMGDKKMEELEAQSGRESRKS